MYSDNFLKGVQHTEYTLRGSRRTAMPPALRGCPVSCGQRCVQRLGQEGCQLIGRHGGRHRRLQPPVVVLLRVATTPWWDGGTGGGGGGWIGGDENRGWSPASAPRRFLPHPPPFRLGAARQNFSSGPPAPTRR